MSEGQAKGLRPHSKSRGGCKICKLRRVKCNEARPSCESCTRRTEHCEYPDELPRNRKARYDINESLSSARYNSSSPIQETRSRHVGDLRLKHETLERRLLEIRLMHQFVTSTVQSDFLSTHDRAMIEVWLKIAPTLALDHPFLMNAILSISALHMFKTQLYDTDMLNNHQIYFNAALSQHREAVKSLRAANAEALCVSTLLISLPPIALLQDTDITNYSPPMQIFDLLAGSLQLFALAAPFVSPQSRVMAIVNANLKVSELQRQADNAMFGRRFAALIGWRAENEVLDEESHVAYEKVLRYVGFMLSHIETGLNQIQLRQLWHAFPTFAPAPFVEGLRNRNPRALVLLAYFFSLTTSMDNVWWIQGIARKQVLGIQGIVPANWQWAMVFPLQRLPTYVSGTMTATQSLDDGQSSRRSSFMTAPMYASDSMTTAPSLDEGQASRRSSFMTEPMYISGSTTTAQSPDDGQGSRRSSLVPPPMSSGSTTTAQSPDDGQGSPRSSLVKE